MQNNPITSDVVKHIKGLEKRLSVMENRPTGTIVVDKQIITTDPSTGVKTVIGNLASEGEDRHGIMQWVGDVEPPPVPSTPIVTAQPGVFSIVWSGFNENFLPHAPDFSHLNIYGNQGIVTRTVGVLKTASETATFVEGKAGETWTFWLTAVDQNGNESAASELSPPIATITMLEDPRISEALNDAFMEIDAAYNAATGAQSTADGKNRIWRTMPPVGTINMVGDTLFDSADGNKIKTWNGTAWVGTRDVDIDKAISDILAASSIAGSARTVAAAADALAGSAWAGAQAATVAAKSATAQAASAWNTAASADATAASAWTAAKSATSVSSAANNAATAANANAQAATAQSASAWTASKAATAAAAAATAESSSAWTTAKAANNSATAAAQTANTADANARTATAQATSAITAAQSATAVAGSANTNAAAATAQAASALTAARSATAVAGSATTTANAANAAATAASQTATAAQAAANAATAQALTATNSASSANTTAISALNSAATAQYTATMAAQDALLAAGLAGTKGRIWPQISAPEAGATYLWDGTAFQSTSTKKVNGVEVKKNLAKRPVPTAALDWPSNNGSTFPSYKTNDGVRRPGTYAMVGYNTYGNKTPLSLYSVGGNGYSTVGSPAVVPGATMTYSLYMRSNVQATACLTVTLHDASFGYKTYLQSPIATLEPSETRWTRLVFTFVVPSTGITSAALGMNSWLIGAAVTDGTQKVWAQDAMLEVGGTATEYFDGSVPGDREFDLWIDTDNGNLPHRWNASTLSWDPAQDQAIVSAASAAVSAQNTANLAVSAAASAASAAGAAQSTANGKNTTWFTTTTPPTPNVADDTWFNPSEGFRMRRYNNGTWNISAFDTEAFAAASITANLLASESVVAGKVAAGAISASSIVAQTIDASLIKGNAITASALAAGSITASALAAGSITASAIASQTITATAIAGNAITATAINAGSIAASHIAVGSIAASHIAANAITATAIAANAITVDKLAVGDFTNLIPNADLVGGAGTTLPAAWTRSGTATATSIADTGGLPGRAFKLDGIGSQVYVWTDLFDVTPTDSLKLSYRSQNQLTGTGSSAQIRFYWYLKSGAPSAILASTGYTVPNGAWAWTNQTIPTPTEVPADAYQCRVMILVSGTTSTGGSWWIGDLVVRRMYGGQLIVDGSIGATHVAASAISAVHLAANAITATAIAASAITATAIRADQITASHIVANQITASHIVADQIAASHIVSNAITADELAATAVNASHIRAGAITASHLTSNTVTATAIQSGTIAASHLSANSITATAIAARAITADKLIIGDFTDSVDDGRFEAVGLPSWSGATTVDATNLYDGRPTLKLGAGADFGVVQTREIDVTPGDKFLVEVIYKTSSDRVGPGGVRFRAPSGVEAASFTPGSEFVTNTNWTTGVWTATIVAGMSKFSPRLATAYSAGNVWIAGFSVRRMMGGRLIVEGSIAANHIASNAITATAIAAGQITASHLVTNAITATAIAATSIAASHIRAGAITASHLTSDAITTTALKAGTIAASHLTSNVITATAIAAKAITADKLMISDFTNLVVGGGFEEDLQVNWTTSNTSWVSLDSTVKRSGTRSMKVTGTGAGYASINNPTFTVRSGEYLKITAYVLASSTAVFDNGFRISFSSGGTGSWIGNIPTTIVKDGVFWNKLEWTTVVPTGATLGTLRLDQTVSTGTLWFDDISVQRMNAGELIVDGSIGANHIAASSITATAIRSSSIAASHIITGAITADKVAANSIGVEKLLVSSFDNLLVNPSFDATVWNDGWTVSSLSSTNVSASTHGNTGNAAVHTSVGSALEVGTSNYPIKVATGDAYTLSAWYFVEAGTTAGTLEIRFKDQLLGARGTINVPYTTALNKWARISTTLEVPSGVTELRANLLIRSITTGKRVWIDDVSITRAAQGHLIVDGAIDGRTITGALVQSDPATNRGVKLSSTGIKAYNTSGDEVFSVDNNGTAKFKGSIEVGSDVPASVIPALDQSKITGLSGDLASKVPTISSAGTTKVFRDVLSYEYATASVAGALVIETPITFNNYMTRIKINGFQYSSGASSVDLDVSFYSYTTPSFINHSATSSGAFPVNVRLARKISNGTVAVILNPVSGSWSYPKLNIPEALIGHSTPPNSFGTGWSVAHRNEDLSLYDTVTSPTSRDMDSAFKRTAEWTYPGTTQINGGDIRTGTVSATQIAATAIDGKTITGATIQTMAASGQGIKLDGTNNLFSAWNTSGIKTFELNGNTGGVMFTGDYYSDVLNKPRVRISSSLYTTGYAGMTFEADGTPSGRVAGIKTSTQNDVWKGALFLTSATYPDNGYDTNMTEMRLASDRLTHFVNGPDTFQKALYEMDASGYVATTTFTDFGSIGQENRSPAGELLAWSSQSGASHVKTLHSKTGQNKSYFSIEPEAILMSWAGTSVSDLYNKSAYFWMHNTGGVPQVEFELGTKGTVLMNRLRISSTDDVSETSTLHGLQLGPSTSYNVRMDQNEFFAMNAGSWSPFYFKASLLGMEAKSRAYMVQENGANVEIGNDTTGLYLKSKPADTRTTTRAANVNMYYEIFHRVSSASRYKIDPITLPENWDDRLLSLRATYWFDVGEAEAVAEHCRREAEGESPEDLDMSPSGPLRRVPGMIAEEVRDAGLDEFVVYGEDGEIEGLMYDRLGVALIPVVGRLRDRISDLEAKVDRLLEAI